VLDPQDPQDLIDGWNYRLIERNILPANLSWIGEHVTVERIDGGKLRCTGATWSDAVVIYPR
jgi:hypothetical protein